LPEAHDKFMAFIKVHLWDRDHPVQHELHLNTDHILSFEPLEKHTILKLTNNDEVEIEESIEKLAQLLERS
jgi:hypothetical protein